MKKVGIFTRIDKLNNKEILYIPLNIYKKFFKRVNVILIPFSLDTKFNDIMPLVDMCDGIVLPGGDDIYPLELEVVKYLYEIDKPLLGICLGMQTMGVSINGCLGHLPDLFHKSNKKYVHEIKISRDSFFYKIINKRSILVNSRHKDYIVNTSLFVGATYNNIIEEVEDKSKRCFIGVQWHPEDLEDVNSEKIFDFFINSL